MHILAWSQSVLAHSPPPGHSTAPVQNAFSPVTVKHFSGLHPTGPAWIAQLRSTLHFAVKTLVIPLKIRTEGGVVTNVWLAFLHPSPLSLAPMPVILAMFLAFPLFASSQTNLLSSSLHPYTRPNSGPKYPEQLLRDKWLLCHPLWTKFHLFSMTFTEKKKGGEGAPK